MTDEIDTLQLFHQNLLALTRLVIRLDRKIHPVNAKKDKSPEASFQEYVKKAPNYGLDTTLNDVYAQVQTLYTERESDIIELYDDWIFKPAPLEFVITKGIKLPLGKLYTGLPENYQNEVFTAAITLLQPFATGESAKNKLAAFLATKAPATDAANPMGDLLSTMMSGLGGDAGLGSLLTQITAKLSSAAPNPDDPTSIDASKIGDFVKELITDQSEGSIVSQLEKNPMFKDLAEKTKGLGLDKLKL